MASIVAAWPTVALGEVLQQVSRTENVQADKEYRLLGIRLDGNGPFLRETKLGGQVAASVLSSVTTGDFIYSRLFAWRGAFGIIDGTLDGCYVSGEFPTFRPVAERIDIAFLRYWFRLPSTLATVEADCSGSTPLTRNRFKETFFMRLQIPLPPLDEQRRVVARIEELAARIEEARGLRREAVAEAATFMSSMHLELSGTRRLRLGEVLSLDEEQEGITSGKLYPQVGIRGFGGGMFTRSTLDATQTTYRTFNRLYDGAIVLSQVKGWEGAIAGCGPDYEGMYASPEYRTFRCKPQAALSQYMAALVVTPWFWNQLSSMTRGVGARRERTRPEQFLALEIPMPTVERQRLALRTFAHLDEMKRLQTETAAELDALLPSVLDKAFRGEL
jgi:type I restriction enzyme S subunit